MQQEFITQLSHWQFDNEADYLSACLSGEERQALKQKSQALAEQQTRLKTLLHEKGQLLVSEEKKQLTDEPLETLKETEAFLAGQQQQLQQEIGAIRQQLQDNENSGSSSKLKLPPLRGSSGNVTAGKHYMNSLVLRMVRNSVTLRRD